MAANDQPYIKMAGQKSISGPDLFSFPLFPRLPIELRLQIWNHALDAFPDRLISVEIWTLEYLSCHACETSRYFLHRSGPCLRARLGQCCRHPSACIADGYFSEARRDVNDVDALSREFPQNFSQVCCEAREVVLKRYPESMRVYRERWNGDASPYRIVRCNPAKDTLLITNVPLECDGHPGFGRFRGIHENKFPKNASHFASFRNIISSFQHVAANCIGGGDSYPIDTRRSHLDFLPSTDIDIVRTMDFVFLLFHFESMKTLHLRPVPRYWPEVYKDMIKVEDIRTIQCPKVNIMKDLATNIIWRYGRYAAIANYAECEEHWMPRPKALEKIGCYANADWIPK